MGKQWVVINQTDDYIICTGIFDDYYKAVGFLCAEMADEIDDWLNDNSNGYKLVKKDEWCRLEADSGWGFFATLERESSAGDKYQVHENWYLLENEDYIGKRLAKSTKEVLK